MEWRHDVSKDWLVARKGCLTATDIVSLIPAYKSLKKKDPTFSRVLSSQFAGKIGEKSFTDADVHSYGPAARGHVLEPYAVLEFNKQGLGLPSREYRHWDDVVICKSNSLLGFSPDAMDVPDTGHGCFMEYCDGPDKMTANGLILDDQEIPSSILEIKSYGAKHHAQCCAAGKLELDERYQIATAMAVCGKINVGYLMFYNPSDEFSMMPVPQICVKEYHRNDLADEIQTCMNIAEAYEKQLLLYQATMAGECAKRCVLKNEEEIWEETMNDGLAMP